MPKGYLGNGIGNHIPILNTAPVCGTSAGETVQEDEGENSCSLAWINGTSAKLNNTIQFVWQC